ncbi:spore germination protein KC [Desulfitispora alkaliphila]|uniref:Ger(x)C family spore germination protein n=1 Tax=Desulfitispora alkaliphila TaxID=622674 RepID=UPI003D1A8717
MNKKKHIICVLLITFIFITGCWNKVELSERALVMGTGIDKGEDGTVKVTIQVLQPIKKGIPAAGIGGEATDNAVWVTTSTGETLFDAVRNFGMQSGRKLFFQYNEIIVIGEEVAREGILPLLDFFARDHELRLNQQVLIAEGEAVDVLNATHQLEIVPANAIRDLAMGKDAIGTTVSVTLFDLTGMLANKSTSPVATRIELFESTESEGNEETEQNGEGEQTNKKLRVTGAAVFREDKLVGFFDKPETRGLNWILGEVVQGIIVASSPLNPQEKVSIEIIRAGGTITPEFKDGDFSITVMVDMEGTLGEQQSRVNLTEEQRWTSLEKRTEAVIENEIKAALEKAQKEYKTDIFGFGDAIYRNYPTQWREIEDNWEEVFSQMDVNIEVNAKLRRSGITRTPITPN